MPRSVTCLALLLASAVAACGARTAISVPEPDDSRPDAGRDGGSDGGFDGGPPGILEVDCGRSEQFTTPRRPITLEGMASGPDPIVSQSWQLISSPPGDAPLVQVEPMPNRITLTPMELGEHLMRFRVVDSTGRAAECEVRVQAVVGPPVALCPEEDVAGIIDVPVLVMGDGFDDDMVIGFLWELVDAPPGAMPRLTGVDTPLLELIGSVRGVYRLRLTVVDPDMAMDSCEVAVVLTGPPEVMCPGDAISAPTRQPVTIMASATDDVGIVSERWELVSAPPGSTAAPTPTDANPTRFTPDKQGRYLLRFTATDVEGLSASCEVTVIGTPTPPDVTCPMVVTTVPLTGVEITAMAVDDGTIVSWQWSITDRPVGSRAAQPSPRGSATTTFTPDIAGIYELTVTATDDDGMTGTCVTRVEAGNVDGLRVEMFWDTNRTDMDTHLLNPTGSAWFNDDDCYFSNCTTGGGGGPRLMWGPGGPEDDPRLDIDDTDGFGPENINIERPEVGTYRIAIHNWRGGGPNRTTVRIYCGGSTTTPRQTFGPVALRDGGGGDFWRVADVIITASGCSITDLARPTGPWIEPRSSTDGMR